MSWIDAMKRDREAGTPGPWSYDEVEGEIFHDDSDVMPWVACVNASETGDSQFTADTRRIARVPDMEAAVLAAVELINAVEQERNMVCQDYGKQAECASRVDAAIAAFRLATGGGA